MTSEEGASRHERLLAAAKEDNEDMLMDIIDDPEPFDINYQDGLGNTALHYAVLHASLDVLEHILCHEECDVDPVNRLEKATPLHLAVVVEDPENRARIVKSLLEAGADYTVRNKHGETAEDLVKPSDERIIVLFREARAEAQIYRNDIAYDDDDDVASDGSD